MITQYEHKSRHIRRGGSWSEILQSSFLCTDGYNVGRKYRNFNFGFRSIILLNSKIATRLVKIN